MKRSVFTGTASSLHQSLLLMKQTPADVKRVTSELFTAQSDVLDQLPREAIFHFFNEFSIAMLNWMGKGQTESIEDTLRFLGRSILNKRDLSKLNSLTAHERIGMQLSTMCGIMSVYLKVQTSVSYNALLIGRKTKLCREILNAFVEEHQSFYQDPKRSADEIKIFLDSKIDESISRGHSRQNINIQLKNLVMKGLVKSETRGNRVVYSLTDLGKKEAMFHRKHDIVLEPA